MEVRSLAMVAAPPTLSFNLFGSQNHLRPTDVFHIPNKYLVCTAMGSGCCTSSGVLSIESAQRWRTTRIARVAAVDTLEVADRFFGKRKVLPYPIGVYIGVEIKTKQKTIQIASNTSSPSAGPRPRLISSITVSPIYLIEANAWPSLPGTEQPQAR